jgi:hypothetical protein
MKNIDVYYESLRQVYEQISDWKPDKPRVIKQVIDWLIWISGVLFGISLVPILPFVLMLLRNQIPIIIGPIDTTTGSFSAFGAIWIVSLLATAFIFFPLLWLSSKVDEQKSDSREGPPQSLSPEQFTFISIYEAYKELKVYFISHIDQHIENSIQALRRILPTHQFILSDREFEIAYQTLKRMALYNESDDHNYSEITYKVDISPEYLIRRYRSNFQQDISIARSFLRTFGKYPWLDIGVNATSTLQAFVALPSKLHPRLREGEELPKVLLILENLSSFLYAFLPEHETNLDQEKVNKLYTEGIECMHKFVSEVNELSQYTFEKEQPEEKEEIVHPSLWKRIPKYFLVKIFVRVTVWFLLLLVLTSGSVYLFNLYIPLTPDTMATVIIGSSVAGAAALAVFLPSQQEMEEGGDKYH